jgi:alginate O-acetyltransferase complex protein AlgI
MQFNSFSYLLCLLVAVVVFWALPVRLRRPYVLLLSVAFYATWNMYLVFLPVAICTVSFIAAQVIRRNPQKSGLAVKLGVTVILIVLGVCKYRGFVLDNVAMLSVWLRSHPAPAIFMIGLPLGISFYSFEAISYLIDTRQGRVPSASFLDLCLFVMFWPHLIAGPIVRSRELIPQLKFCRPFENRFLLLGLDRLLLGLVQKNLIANNLGSWLDDGFLPRVAALNTSVDNWFLAVAFGLQIYFDFSAYSNMAIGAAQLIGVTLPENFRFPYYASTPADFWSRWHMTLSRWIRDYVFFPLNAGFENRKLRLYGSMIGVMALVGLWHGAGWGFMLWGAMHGIYLVIYRAFSGPDGSAPKWPVRLFWRVFTLVAVTAAWVPFRAASLGQSAAMLSSMFWRINLGTSYSINFYLVTLLCCAFCLAEPYFGKWINSLDTAARSGPLPAINPYLLRPLAYACLLLMFLIFDDRDAQFIYFQF